MENQVQNSILKDSESRNKVIVRTSIIGILANLLLAAFKAVIGLGSGSIAIVLDAVNNLSDAASSVITIVGTKLAGREPDKKHPFGYGRIEYLSALVISLIVLYAGITSLTESVKSILHPQTPEYTTVSLIIVAVAVVVKILLGSYVKKVGEKVHSDSLVNSGQDATLDSIISASTLVAAVLFLTVHVSIEAWLGAVISIVIIKSGFEMIQETLSEILGERADASLVREIKKTVLEFPDVSGAYDLVLNNYGPDTFNGSIHIEVPDTYSANDLDQLIRQIQVKVYMEHQVILTAIGVYSVNTKDAKAIEIREAIREKVLAIPNVMQMHGFYLDESSKVIRFDVVIGFGAFERRVVFQKVNSLVQENWPEYRFEIAMDMDYSEE